MIDAHLRRLRKRDTISAAEERAIRGLVSETRRVRAHEVLIRKDQLLDHSILLIDGWLGRAVDLQSGVRVFTEVHVAGDFADLHGFSLKRLDHDVVALAESLIALVPHDRLTRLARDFPRLMRIYWFSTNVDAAIHRQWIVSVGRSAASRMAHLFCELFLRLEAAGVAGDPSFDFPLTQDQLASCLNLTPVHVNRTLQVLRRQSLVELDNKRLAILDFPALRQVAEFDPAYLYLEREPR
ncbi:MAG TPA: Crp/Fnr family transcriptional regulator [Sphingomicrobium sp.]